MCDVKIIPNGDADINASIRVLEAVWVAGATQVSVVRANPVVIEMSVISGTSDVECNECEIALCTQACQRERRIVRAQRQVEVDEAALIRSTAHLREVVLHG